MRKDGLRLETKLYPTRRPGIVMKSSSIGEQHQAAGASENLELDEYSSATCMYHSLVYRLQNRKGVKRERAEREGEREGATERERESRERERERERRERERERRERDERERRERRERDEIETRDRRERERRERERERSSSTLHDIPHQDEFGISLPSSCRLFFTEAEQKYITANVHFWAGRLYNSRTFQTAAIAVL